MGRRGEWFRASAVGRLFGAQFTAQRAVIVRAPAESTALGRLIEELAEEDAIHDREVRFGVGLMRSRAGNLPPQDLSLLF